MESSHFLAISSPWSLYKTLFFDFWFRPPNSQNLLPKICTKSPIRRLVWQIERRCLGLPGGFRGWTIQWNHAKCCEAHPCCHGNEICTKSPICRLVWQIDRRCLGLLGGFRGWLIQWNHTKCCGPTLVAMATKFGLGAEIQSPTGLSTHSPVMLVSIAPTNECCNVHLFESLYSTVTIALYNTIVTEPGAYFTQPPMMRMRICFRDFFLFFPFFSVRHKIPDNRSRERLNGFSWNFYQTIPGKMVFATSCRRLANGECWWFA